ncbi:MAG TPA: site-2 protease family protein [candidate division Zixibacteria bacterium]|nr:site-2 protease family protein [candidate division Zixibacteria bacterium]
MATKEEQIRLRESALGRLRELLNNEYVFTAIGDYGNELVVRVEPRVPILTPPPNTAHISAELDRAGFPLRWEETTGGYYARIRFPEARVIPWKNIIMFALTLVTVFFVPQYSHYVEVTVLDLAQEPVDLLPWLGSPELWKVGWGASFTFWLLGILLAHEFGHYFAGRRRGLTLTLPFFIPAPWFIGTMGAVIRFKSPIENRRDLIEVGAAGPIAGFIVALAAVVVGMLRSDPAVEGLFSMQGGSLLMTALGKVFLTEEAFNSTFRLAPAAFAGWVGFLVTALNMLPLSQLDGGHITYGLFGKRQRSVAIAALAALVVAGFSWPAWWLYAGLTFAFGPFHPPTLHDEIPISRTARVMGWVSLVIFVLTVNLAPFGVM